MSRRPTPIKLQVLPPDLSIEEITKLLAEATVILLKAKERRLARLAQQEQDLHPTEMKQELL